MEQVARYFRLWILAGIWISSSWASAFGEHLISWTSEFDAAPESSRVFLRGADGSIEHRQAHVEVQRASGAISLGALITNIERDMFVSYCFEVVDTQGKVLRSDWLSLNLADSNIEADRERILQLRLELAVLEAEAGRLREEIRVKEEYLDSLFGGGELAQARARVRSLHDQEDVLRASVHHLTETILRGSRMPTPGRMGARERELVQHLSELIDKISEEKALREDERAHAPGTIEELESRISDAANLGDGGSLVAEQREVEVDEEGAIPHYDPGEEGSTYRDDSEHGTLLHEYD